MPVEKMLFNLSSQPPAQLSLFIPQNIRLAMNQLPRFFQALVNLAHLIGGDGTVVHPRLTLAIGPILELLIAL